MIIKRLITVISRKKKLIQIDNVDVNKKLIKENHTVMLTLDHYVLCIKVSQMIRYAKYFDGKNTASIKVSDKRLLKK